MGAALPPPAGSSESLSSDTADESLRSITNALARSGSCPNGFPRPRALSGTLTEVRARLLARGALCPLPRGLSASSSSRADAAAVRRLRRPDTRAGGAAEASGAVGDAGGDGVRSGAIIAGAAPTACASAGAGAGAGGLAELAAAVRGFVLPSLCLCRGRRGLEVPSRSRAQSPTSSTQACGVRERVSGGLKGTRGK